MLLTDKSKEYTKTIIVKNYKIWRLFRNIFEEIARIRGYSIYPIETKILYVHKIP